MASAKGKTTDADPVVSSAFTYDLPPEPQDVPPPKGGVRRVDLEDGRWVDIRAAGSQTDGRFLAWWDIELARANNLEPGDEKDAVVLGLNARLAKFVGDRVPDHNLTYPGTDELLPTGYEMFWEMQAGDVFSLIALIQNPQRQIRRLQDPKPDAASTSG